ncbi:MAG: YebC/PmpR family DNA-binding transcriptional regulator [Candidatus Marinimicrobia bacterium]|jgi:YebC/PmpR family DNA-binding regulatory protein|nr:YebC/PmpR family DNA-binding transcriptional regulator [Candidatus Neomarinimicrobiota bacterium]
MSGHSKWSTIKRKKGALDAKRGRTFTKIIKEIQVAAKMGGGDENANPRLRTAIQAAKAANMPLINVERAIKKGTGELEGTVYEEINYEAYGPGGVAILMESMTDNKNRTVSEIRHILSRAGGNLATAGSVAYNFEKKGIITVDKKACTEDDLLLIVTDAGADDLTVEEEFYEVSVEPHSFEIVKKALNASSIAIAESSITMVPKTTVKLDEKAAQKILSLMDALEEHEDIQNVYGNFDIDDAILNKLQENA